MQPADGPARRLAAAPQGWDILPLPAIELSSDAQALQVNGAMAALAGLAESALLGTGWFAVLSPDRRAALFDALSAQADFELPIRLLRHDRVKAWVDVSARWLPQSGSFLCLLHDRTPLQMEVQDAQAVASRFSLLADNVPVLIAYYESAGFTCLYANRQYAATFGLAPEAVVGRTVTQVIGEKAAAEIQPHVDDMLRLRRTVSYTRSLPLADGRTRWLEVSLVPHLGSDGHPFGSFVLINDITRHREAEALVRESEERMAKFMEASVEGIVFHRDGLITDLNAPMAALVGGTRAELLGRHVMDFVAPAQQARVQQVMSQGAELRYETEIVDLAGQPIAVEFIVRTLVRGNEKLRMTIVRDIRDRQAAQARIRQLAHHDALTGLHNRGAFVERLEAELAHPTLPGSVGLMFMDLDHFKRINDSLGHLAGDALLRTLGARIADLLPPQGAAGRFGGDEFVVLLPGVADAEAAQAWAERLRAAVQSPVLFHGRPLVVTPTIGIALFPEHGRDADSLLRHADAALYAGKAAGRNAVTVYERSLGDAIEAEVQLESDLTAALRRGELALVFDRWVGGGSESDTRVPEVQAARVVWHHPRRGLVEASTLAQSGAPARLLARVAEFGLREATLRRAAMAPGTGLVFDGAGLLPGVAALLALAGTLPADEGAGGPLWLTLNERQAADDPAALARVLVQLQDRGVGVLLSDFGAGGLGLSRLRDLPVAGWCLDRALLQALPGDPAAAAIAQAQITLARALGRMVVARPVEHEAQRRWLLAAGCHWVSALATSGVAAPAPATGAVAVPTR